MINQFTFKDGNGGIWIVELDVDKLEECNHRKVLVSHAGAIVTMIALRNHPILITAGEDGAIMAYSTETHKLLARYIFPAAVTSMLYPPIDVSIQFIKRKYPVTKGQYSFMGVGK